MFIISVIVVPPDDDGGIENRVYPRYVLRIGWRHTGW
jgi:hypothetical protein